MSLYLVSCVSQKLAIPAPAKDLYNSSLFQKSRAYAERLGQPWFILSAKYGLVHPDHVIEPYDLTLNGMGVADRRRWANTVMSQLQPHLHEVSEVVFLAGRNYCQYLEPQLVQRGIAVQDPMRGLQIGRRLSWLNAHNSG